jgi:hypothetical protein
MRIALLTFVALGLGGALISVVADERAEEVRPEFDASGQLVRPANYREWVWLSSGLGMSYGPNAGQPGENPPFDNVFVNPPAYRAFMASGKWPDDTVLVLEIRSSASKGSINRDGHFQADLRAIEAEVKRDGKWSFYAFNGSGASARRIPGGAACYTCHAANGAVDNTFVQFYPTLLEVARAKGTLKATAAEAR